MAAVADVGLIGLAVMGENLALNMADHGFKVAVYNRTTEIMKKFIARENPPGGLVGCETLQGLRRGHQEAAARSSSWSRPGAAVDAVVKQLFDAGVEPDDIVVDCGNSHWTDTIRREKEYAAKCKFFGSGVSGGELGARFGPVDDARRRSGFLEAPQAHLGGGRRQGRCQDRQAPGKLRPRQARRRRRALHHLPRPQRGRATTSRWSTTASNTSTCSLSAKPTRS